MRNLERMVLNFLAVAVSSMECGCSSSDPKQSELQCGSGTNKVGSTCVAQNGGGAGSSTAGGAGVLVCGSGTVRLGNECIVALGGAAGTSNVASGGTTQLTSSGADGGVAFGGMAPAGGNTATAGNTTIAGGTATAGGAASLGGAANLGGTSAGGTTTAGAAASLGGAANLGGTTAGGRAVTDVGGMGSAGTLTAGGGANTAGVPSFAGAAGNASTVTLEPRWFALRQTNLSLYDRRTYPDTTPYILSTSAAYVLSEHGWSPDRQKVLYYDGGLKLRRLTDTGPSEPTSLGNLSVVMGRRRTSAWSADSLSLMVSNSVGVGVIDPTRPLPVVNNLVTTGNVAYTWAPVGTKLFLVDDNGGTIVDVQAGVPQAVGRVVSTRPSEWVWTPRGDGIATCTQGQVDYTAIDTVGVQTKRLTSPVVSSPTCVGLYFNPQGTRLAFSGQQGKSTPELHWYAVNAEGPGAQNVVSPTETVTTFDMTEWSKTGDFASVSTIISGVSHQFFVNLAGTTAGQLIDAGSVTTYDRSWAATQPRIAFRNATYTSVAAFDCLNPADGVYVVAQGDASTPIRQLAFAPNSAILAYSQADALKLADTNVRGGPVVTVTPDVSFLGPQLYAFSWSPDGAYLSATVALTSYVTDQYTLHLMRVNGLAMSAPILLAPSSTTVPSVDFQP